MCIRSYCLVVLISVNRNRDGNGGSIASAVLRGAASDGVSPVIPDIGARPCVVSAPPAASPSSSPSLPTLVCFKYLVKVTT